MTKKNQTKQKNIFQKHPLVFLLIGALILTFLWGTFKANRIEKKLTNEHEKELFELRSAIGEELIRVFAWSIRSELTRNNEEQAQQYMLSLLRGRLDIKNVQYIDLNTQTITFSSDKKEEGKKVENSDLLSVKEVNHQINENIMRLMAPVMGFDSQLGVLIVDWEYIAQKEEAN